MTPADRPDDLVERIVEALFTNGSGDRARRLVLTAADGRDLGGWSETGAAACVRAVLVDADTAAARKARA